MKAVGRLGKAHSRCFSLHTISFPKPFHRAELLLSLLLSVGKGAEGCTARWCRLWGGEQGVQLAVQGVQAGLHPSPVWVLGVQAAPAATR